MIQLYRCKDPDTLPITNLRINRTAYHTGFLNTVLGVTAPVITRNGNQYVSGSEDYVFHSKKKDASTILTHPENYGPFVGMATGEEVTLVANDITPENFMDYYNSLFSIMKDGIYCEQLHPAKIKVVFILDDGTEESIKLTIPDMYFNLIQWYQPIFLGIGVKPWHIFFPDEIRAKAIANFINDFTIEPTRGKCPIRTVSNVVAASLYFYHDIDHFANYLSNTLNLDDTAELMLANPDYDKVTRTSYKNLPVDEVSDAISADANASIAMIKQADKFIGHDHCLVDAWRANEGINPKQYAEFCIGIGMKPDGRGGIFDEIVDTSFIGGGIKDPTHYFIESSTSRISQIEKHKNVRKSGTLARIMGLNNMDSYLCDDPTYDCHSAHPIPITITSVEFLKHLNLRYYRLHPQGQERRINYKKDTNLVGKTIYLRSPCTCASAARGHGVCYKCYGDLAYSNADAVNIGRIASEFITAKQTQTQLSVKHILKAAIDKIIWSPDFDAVMEMENTIIRFNSDIENLSDYKLIIEQDSIESDSDFESGATGDEDDYEPSSNEFDDFITEFYILQKSTGQMFHITTESLEKLFITNELNAIIRKKTAPTDDRIEIPMTAIKDAPMFWIKVKNNEISRVMIKLKNLFNRSNEVRGRDISSLLQEILETNIEGNMNISAVHYEVILSNQIKDADDVLKRPDWNDPNPQYRMMTLDEALTKNPAVCISLSYQKITKSLYDPLTFKKTGASFMDPFFMVKPQEIVGNDKLKPIEEKHTLKVGEYREPIEFIDDVDKITVEEPSYSNEGEIIDVEE